MGRAHPSPINYMQEPNQSIWVDPTTGLTCAIIRTPYLGNLCGYVEVPPSIQRGRRATHEYPELYVHGGLTFTGPLHLDDDWIVNLRGEIAWFLGFDCAHAGDRLPGLPPEYQSGVYRDWDYVRGQIEQLARQIKASRPSIQLTQEPHYV